MSRTASLLCRLGILGPLALAAGCTDNGPEVPGPHYLAIVTRADFAPGIEPDSFYAYHIRDFSGNAGVDTVVLAAPRDTVILSVPPARYIVTIGGVPAYCAIRQGAEQEVLIPERTNTAIVRYSISCLPRITLQVSTEGVNRDAEYIYRVLGNGVERIGAIDSMPLYFDNLSNGEYLVELADVKPNCTAINLGGRLQHAIIADTLSSLVYFRVACSDPASRPSIVSVSGQAFDGAVALVARVVDPDRDLDLYAADVTDCQGRSILPSGGIEPRHLSGTRLALEDTAAVMVTLAMTGVPPAVPGQSCLWFRMGDLNGNTTEVIEQPLAQGGSPLAPVAVRLNGFISGGLNSFFVDLQADDPDGDFLGIQPRLRLRDGTLGPPDGQEDGGIYDPIGYRGTDLPVVPIGPGHIIVNYFDILAVEVYLFDGAGHITRAVDDHL
jgi:hypothetical protein